MRSRSSCRPMPPRSTESAVRGARCWLWLCAAAAFASLPAQASVSVPDWMQAVAGAPTPAHDDQAGAVMLYSNVILTVQPNGKIRRLTREVLRVLRPEAGGRAVVRVYFDDQSRILSMHGWCLPLQGKPYEVKERDAMDVAPTQADNGNLVDDEHARLLRIPAADPGNLIAYEYEQELHPYFLDDEWNFQDTVPVGEAHYTLQLPAGWSYRSSWVNHAELPATQGGAGQWSWTVGNVAAIREERDMPPWRGVAARMVIALVPSGGQRQGWISWNDIGNWQSELARDRRQATADIQQKVQALTAGESTTLGKMRALAKFVQSDIRYVAIELGIGGFQPHSAADVLTHRYGDCKDKATLLSAMLRQIGVESYYVIVNTERGAVTADTPPNLDFNHVILAIRVPPEAQDASLVATLTQDKLGKLLVFDPTDDLTPFGQLRGPLQASYALLVMPEGGELLALPQLGAQSSTIQRTALMTLDAGGVLSGDIHDVQIGDPARASRNSLRAVQTDADRAKLIESQLADSIADFRITKASLLNAEATDRPFEWRYSLEAAHYAKVSGDLLLVRPRVLGNDSSGLLETREPRENAIEFDGPEQDTDSFDIALPAGFEVDELPPAVDLDYGFATYHSKTQLVGHSLHYTRVLEIRELSVPVAKADSLRQFYRLIASDERRVAVLKRTAAN